MRHDAAAAATSAPRPGGTTGGHATTSAASAGTRGSGLCRSGWRACRGSVSRNWAPSCGLAPGLQPPAVQVGVLERDRQAQAGATAGAGASGIGAPEAVEHHRRLADREPDAVVADRDRGRLLVGGDGDHDLRALGVVDRVDDEVAHDPLHPAYVAPRRCTAGPGRGPRRWRLRWSARARVTSTTRRATSVRLTSSRSSTAAPGVEPADLEQVDEQRLEPVELALQQLGGAPRLGVEGGLARRGGRRAGHPHRRQRRAQLVGHVGDEPALDAGQLLELADLALEVGRHRVERRRQARQVVLAAHPHPLLEPPGRQSLGDPPAIRTGVTTCRVTNQASPASSTRSSDAGGQQRPGDEGEASPLGRRAGRGSRPSERAVGRI